MLDLLFIRKRTFAKLGEFTFELKSLVPDRIERESQYRWVRQEPLKVHPVFQFLGAGSEEFILTGVSYPAFAGGLSHLQKLREMASKGEPQRLSMADVKLGQNLGRWIVLSIKETRTIMFGDGLPRKIKFTIEMETYEPLPAP